MVKILLKLLKIKFLGGNTYAWNGKYARYDEKMQKMQKEMMEAQEALNAEQFEGVAGGGMVKVTVSGQREVVSVNLDESVVDPEDIEMLQDLIVIATNEALKK